MTPTDALRAECEKALREWWISPDPSNAFGRPIPLVDAAFRAGFSVLAARVSEQDAEIAILRKTSNHTGCMEEKAAQLAQREAEVKALRGHLTAVLSIIDGPDFHAAQSMAFVHGWQADPDRSRANGVALDAARAALADRPEET